MKLRNKKTGEIVELVGEFKRSDDKPDFTLDSYETLAELAEEWEDYEEPKEPYFISEYGGIYPLNIYEGLNRVANEDEYKQIGNYFETKEDAEKAVEKLKAWKRLKDKGFKFKCCDDYHIDYEITGKCVWTDETEKDLDLLFGGEE